MLQKLKIGASKTGARNQPCNLRLTESWLWSWHHNWVLQNKESESVSVIKLLHKIRHSLHFITSWSYTNLQPLLWISYLHWICASWKDQCISPIILYNRWLVQCCVSGVTWIINIANYIHLAPRLQKLEHRISCAIRNRLNRDHGVDAWRGWQHTPISHKQALHLPSLSPWIHSGNAGVDPHSAAAQLVSGSYLDWVVLCAAASHSRHVGFNLLSRCTCQKMRGNFRLVTKWEKQDAKNVLIPAMHPITVIWSQVVCDAFSGEYIVLYKSIGSPKKQMHQIPIKHLTYLVLNNKQTPMTT